jgi:hypothetical protein
MTLILGFLLANFFHMSHTFNLHGKAWRGGVRHGSARPGEARLGFFNIDIRRTDRLGY